MERLILLRHGEAEALSESGEDFDRRLAPLGMSDAAAMSARLAGVGLTPDLVLVSPAVRTRQTWVVAESAFPSATVRFDDDLYNADSQAIRRAVSGHAGTVMVVGHNPGLHELTMRLMIAAAAPASDLAAARRGFPPATAVVFAIDAAGQPSLEGLYYPERGD